MAMRPKLWSLSGLAVELGRNVRTVSAALANVPADGDLTVKGKRYDGWTIETALRALGPRTGDARAAANCDELKQIAAELEDGFERLRKEPDIERRRKLAEKVGPLVGKLDRALTRSNALMIPDEDERAFIRLATDRILGQAIGEFIAAARLPEIVAP